MFIVCSKCKKEKEEHSFHNNKARHNGKSAYCISCDKQRKLEYSKTEKGRQASRRRSAKYREEHPEKTKASIQKYKEKKQQLVNEYKTYGCSICGYDKCLQALDLHHKDPQEKDSSVADLVCKAGIARVEEELSKCVVLCANCHREHHAGLLIL